MSAFDRTRWTNPTLRQNHKNCQKANFSPSKPHFPVRPVAIRFVLRTAAAAKSRDFVFGRFRTVRVFYPHIAIHHQRTVGRGFHDGFHVDVFGFAFSFAVPKPSQGTGGAALHLGYDGFGVGALHIDPRSFARVEHRAQVLPAEGGMDTNVGLPGNRDFSVGVMLFQELKFIDASIGLTKRWIGSCTETAILNYRPNIRLIFKVLKSARFNAPGGSSSPRAGPDPNRR
jgi:hypothetical protein